MEINLVTAAGAQRRPLDELTSLLEREDGFVWLDIPQSDEEAARVLREVFGFHPMAVRTCLERNHVPRVHAYADHVFVVLHTPENGGAGHVHLLELDQFVGQRYLVTVHGPINPIVPTEAALTETRAALRRIEAGQFRPTSPTELSYAIVSAVARRQSAFVRNLAGQIAELELRVRQSDLRHPEQLLEEMFLVRHEVLTIRTMAAQSCEIYGRMGTVSRFLPPQDMEFVTDLADQFARVRSLGDGEKEFLFSVIDFYQARTGTKMTIASERLALGAVLTLPITAVASIYGMNFEHMPELKLWFGYPLVIIVMLTMSGLLLRWARRQGWW
jgi:Mg2+ and Co2+ transporter CorA